MINVCLFQYEHHSQTKQESPPAWTQEAYRPQEGARCWPPPPRWLTPPGWLIPPRMMGWLTPLGWQDDWPPPGWLTHPPLAGLTWPPGCTDLTPPPAGLTWPPLQLDWPDPPRLDWPDPPPRLDWPDPSPPAGLTPPPRCGQTENITFPILRMRAVKTTTISERQCQIYCVPPATKTPIKICVWWWWWW